MKCKNIIKYIGTTLIIGIYAFGIPTSFSSAQTPEEKQKQQAEYLEKCNSSKGCMELPSYEIEVGNITPGLKFSNPNDTKENVDTLFGKIIELLIIAFGIIAVFIMTIGAGYIILHNGQDEMLNRGKSIFMAGVYSTAIALGSYIIVNVVKTILYG